MAVGLAKFLMNAFDFDSVLTVKICQTSTSLPKLEIRRLRALTKIPLFILSASDAAMISHKPQRVMSPLPSNRKVARWTSLDNNDNGESSTSKSDLVSINEALESLEQNLSRANWELYGVKQALLSSVRSGNRGSEKNLILD